MSVCIREELRKLDIHLILLHPDDEYDEVIRKILVEFGLPTSTEGKLYFNKALVSRDAFRTVEKCLSSRKCTIKAATFMVCLDDDSVDSVEVLMLLHEGLYVTVNEKRDHSAQKLNF